MYYSTFSLQNVQRLFAVLAILALVFGPFSNVQMVRAVNEPDVKICHADGSGKYETLNIPVAGLNGHGDHKDDIIPSPYYNGGGKNLDDGGQAILDNDCKATGEITVNKVVVNGGEIEDADFELKVGDENMIDEKSKNFVPGTYKVTETPKNDVPTNYTATFSGACDSDGNITVEIGDDKTCTITNEYTTTPTTGTIIVKKEFADGTNPVDEEQFSFEINDADAVSFEADGENLFDGKTPNEYTIVETAFAGYTPSYDNCSFTLAAGETQTCTITNAYTPVSNTGTLEIKKYSCPADTSVVRSQNGVGGTVPAGCELETGATFGYVHGDQTDANSPYPELSASITEAGATTNGLLSVANLDASGRYLVVETDGAGNKLPAEEVLGLYCIGDGDTSDNNDNQELTFITAGETTHCVAYNPAPVVEQCLADTPAWASSVEGFNPGPRKDGSPITDSARTNPDAALGAANWISGGSTGFVSLGFGGEIVVKFTKFVPDVDGDDISVHEGTNGTYPVEKAKVEVSQNGTNWYPLTEEARNDSNEGGARVTLLDFSETGLSWIKYVRLTDTSDSALFTGKPDADGYDLDAVDATTALCDQPADLEVLGCTDPEATNYNPKATSGNEDAEQCEYPEQPVCRIGDNLLANGSFEDDVVTANGGQWHIFSSVTNWVISLSDGLELWKNFNGSGAGLASDGIQNAELDGNSPTRIAQSVVTVPGATYELSFDFSARQNADSAADNSIDALVNGTQLFNVTADGSDITTNTWTNHSQTFVASGTSTEIGFEDKGTANSYGSLMDNAVLCKVSDPEPTPIPGCMNESATNYNPDATVDDNSCTYSNPDTVCEVVVVSDATNTVTEKAGAFAQLLSFVHPAWTAAITGASWIWGDNPVVDPTAAETQTFVKTFDWNGPVTSAMLDIATDNTYVVKLNGVQVANSADENNFQIATQDNNIDVIAGNLVTGTNTLEIAVTNLATPNDSNPANNPAGLMYRLEVSGTNQNCFEVPTPTDTPDDSSDSTDVTHHRGSSRSSQEPDGDVAGVSTTNLAPEGEVLGASTSTLPVGAPNTGAGGTSSQLLQLPTLLAILNRRENSCRA